MTQLRIIEIRRNMKLYLKIILVGDKKKSGVMKKLYCYTFGWDD